MPSARAARSSSRSRTKAASGRPAPAIRGGEGLVGDDVRSDGAIVRHAIRPGQVIDGVLGDGLAERRERAVIPREGGLEGDDGAVARHADPRAVILVSIRRRAQEVLAPALHPLDRPAEPPRHRRHHDLLGVHVALDAEAAAHLGHEHADPLLGQPERHGDGAAHREGHLRRRPDEQGARRLVLGGQDAARLDGHARHARIAQVRLDDHVGRGEARPDIARAGAAHVRDIVRPVVVDEGRRRRHRGGRRRGDRQRLVRDDDPIEGVGQPIGIVGDHDGDGLPHVPHATPREGRVAMGPPARLGHERRHRGGRELRQVVERPHRRHAVEARGRRAVDAEHAGMGVRAPHQAQVQQIGQLQVVEVSPQAGDEAAVFPALEGGAELHRLGTCRRNPARAMRRVELRGGARWQPARRTCCTLSRLSRAPTRRPSDR